MWAFSKLLKQTISDLSLNRALSIYPRKGAIRYSIQAVRLKALYGLAALRCMAFPCLRLFKAFTNHDNRMSDYFKTVSSWMQKDFSYATNARMANCAGKRTASNYTLSAGIIARTNASKSMSLAPMFSQSLKKIHEKT